MMFLTMFLIICYNIDSIWKIGEVIMSDTFYIDSENGSEKCRVITTLYSKEYNHHYLVYEFVDQKSDDLYVSIFYPEEEILELFDVEGKELDDVIAVLENMDEEVD